MERVGCGVEQTVKPGWWGAEFVFEAPSEISHNRNGQGAAPGLFGWPPALPDAWVPSPRSRPGSRPPMCPYPTQAGLAVADTSPVEAGTLPIELLCGL